MNDWKTQHLDPKLPPRFTIAQLAELQADVDGFHGRFVFVVGHKCDECDGIDNALIFEAYDNDLAGCEGWYTIIDDLDIGCADDHEAGEALARMLNAVGPLLAMLKLGGGQPSTEADARTK